MKSNVNVEPTQEIRDLVNSVIDNAISGEEIKNMLSLSSQRLWNKRKGKDKFSDVEATQIKNFLTERINVLSTLLNLVAVEENTNVEVTQNVEPTQNVKVTLSEKLGWDSYKAQKELEEMRANQLLEKTDLDELPY